MVTAIPTYLIDSLNTREGLVRAMVTTVPIDMIDSVYTREGLVVKLHGKLCTLHPLFESAMTML